MAFASLQPPSGVSRRAFLLMPVALTGLVALVKRPERPIPDVAQDGTGVPVGLVAFSNRGERIATIYTKKLVRKNDDWRHDLPPLAFAVTRQQATELAFTGRYWNNEAVGIYRCVCCGNALFRSQDKFDSGTGWPSFSEPIAAENIFTKEDRSGPGVRTEVLCRKCDAHLGHVFDDGPPPSGLRYCLNSVALRFIKFS